MRLLNTRTLVLEYFPQSSGDIPFPYAILSHTWGDDEVTFADIDGSSSASGRSLNLSSSSIQGPNPSAKCPPWHIHMHPERHKSAGDQGSAPAWLRRAGAAKVTSSAAQALKEGYLYIWIDTCCIDKSSSAELSEAINSMFAWYHDAAKCLVYLSDVDSSIRAATTTDPPGESAHVDDVVLYASLEDSRWFTRGWTLQELIAPRELEFYDASWASLGRRVRDGELVPLLSKITGVDERALSGPYYLETTSVASKMSWAANRKTTRPEDGAYCLMGLFGVNMPLLYGEGGSKAFERLQAEIIAMGSDQSILAFSMGDNWTSGSGILAIRPEQFAKNIKKSQDVSLRPWSLVAGELSLDVWLCEVVEIDGTTQDYPGFEAALIDCKVDQEDLSWPVILVSQCPGTTDKYFRFHDQGLMKVIRDDKGTTVLVPCSKTRPAFHRVEKRPSFPLSGGELMPPQFLNLVVKLSQAHRRRITLIEEAPQESLATDFFDGPLGVKCMEPRDGLNLKLQKTKNDNQVSMVGSSYRNTSKWSYKGLACFCLERRNPRLGFMLIEVSWELEKHGHMPSRVISDFQAKKLEIKQLAAVTITEDGTDTSIEEEEGSVDNSFEGDDGLPLDGALETIRDETIQEIGDVVITARIIELHLLGRKFPRLEVVAAAR